MPTTMSGTALIVEDDPALAKAMSLAAKGMGFEVVTASDFRTAVQELKTHRPILVSIDLELPDESGYELCEHIRGPLGMVAIPILVTSTRATLDHKAHAEEAGANAFLAKPFSMGKFRDNVTALFDVSPVSSRDVLRLRMLQR